MFVVAALISWAAVASQHRHTSRDSDLKAQCIAAQGIIRTDDRGRFDGCYYSDHPLEQAP